LNDLLQLAADAVAKGHLSDAIGALREATDLEPGSLDARARLAEAYLAAGDAVQARRFAVTARHFADVGIALQTAGRSDEALDSWRDGVRLYPSDRNLLQCLGAAYRASGREAEARTVDDQLRALTPRGLGVDAKVARRPAEVDLSLELEIIGKAEATEEPLEVEPPSSASLEEVFAQFRDRAARRSGEAGADEAFQRGVALHDAGHDDEALAALREAARGPHRLFAAASLAGRIVRDRGRPAAAIEWFERAAQAPAPTREEGHALLFDLADALESIGEDSRALPVYIEVLADAGVYRDVAARVWRLSNRRARE
jgi:tetratricopeptide (TPR) repeat protein